MPPKFLYFDLGNVLLLFDHHLMCRQMAEVAGIEAERVWRVIFDEGLEKRFETGEISAREFYDSFCRQTGTRPDYDALAYAASAIFEPNAPMMPVLARLSAVGHRLGLLSNICETHWAYCASGRYEWLPGIFDVLSLSYQIGAMKPNVKIFEVAAQRAGVAPGEIFYTDDIAGHVAGALAAGYDAVQYTTTPALLDELAARGIRV
ncbi:MAG: HAD family hydrolase [Pirellulales bacterium]